MLDCRFAGTVARQAYQFSSAPTSILPGGRPTADHSANAVAITRSPWRSFERTSTRMFPAGVKSTSKLFNPASCKRSESGSLVAVEVSPKPTARRSKVTHGGAFCARNVRLRQTQPARFSFLRATSSEASFGGRGPAESSAYAYNLVVCLEFTPDGGWINRIIT